MSLANRVQRQSATSPIVVSEKPKSKPFHDEKFGALTAAQYAEVLACLIASGHGIEAICSFLILTREKLLDLVIEFGVSTPHDRAQRLARGPKAWTSAEHLFLITGWMLLWKPSFIASELGRSKGSVHAKIRRLGLLKRDRSALHTPENKPDRFAGLPLQVALPLSLMTPPGCDDSEILKLAKTWGFDHIPSANFVPQRKKNRPHEIDWTPEANWALSIRRFCNQSHESIAAEWGIPIRALYTQTSRLQIPPMRGRQLRQDYDLAVAFANIKADHHETYLSPEYEINFWRNITLRRSCRLEQQHILRRERNNATICPNSQAA
jgi:hypothetical protein